MWKKHLVGWSNRDRKPTIGSPLLIKTTLEDGMLRNLPTTNEAQARAKHISSPLSPDATPTATPTNPKFMKELPPLDFQDRYRPDRPLSEVPTSSSVYTRQTPELKHNFDSQTTLQPNFIEPTQSIPERPPRPDQDQAYNGFLLYDDSLVNPGSDSPYGTGIFAGTILGLGGALAIETKTRQPWQGASGELEPMTPITATPAGTLTTRSISPIDDALKKQPQQNQNDNRRPELVYPSPDSAKKTPKLDSPPIIQGRYLHTPESVSTDAHMSIGYDVSPWSTPESRPYHRSLYELTPGRNLSYANKIVSASPAQQLRQRSARDRNTFGTQTTDDDRYTEFDMSAPGTTRPSLDDMRKPSSALYQLDRTVKPETPPMQQRAFHVTAKEPTAANQFSPPKISRFSWTTLATETTAQTLDSPTYPVQTAQPTMDSPPPTPPPVKVSKTPQPLSPIMDRRRPISNFNSPHLEGHPALSKSTSPTNSGEFTIRRKPTPSMMASDSSSSMFNIASPVEGKALPTTPSELSTVDYLTTLSAQLESLSHKKHNLLKVIASHEAVTLGPGINPCVVDLAQRKQRKEQIRTLNESLAETRRSEHEIGLKLLKAQKRRDQEGPTALWVRRIAS